MSPKYKASKCNANYICRKCSERHHISICQKGYLKLQSCKFYNKKIYDQMMKLGFSLTTIHESQDCRGRGRAFL